MCGGGGSKPVQKVVKEKTNPLTQDAINRSQAQADLAARQTHASNVLSSTDDQQSQSFGSELGGQ